MKEWCIPKPGAEFVAAMEDVLGVYQRPYDPLRPVICLDETSRQLIAETRTPLPGRPDSPRKHDFEYKRNGVANLFVMFEPLGARRYVEVTETRKRIDFAHVMKKLVDHRYKHAEKLILVMDNLNIHSTASLYEAFAPEEARRLSEKLKIHHTPKHASWLNVAEIEICVMSKQCLSRLIPELELMKREVNTWMIRRNTSSYTVNWQFTTQDARVKVKHL